MKMRIRTDMFVKTMYEVFIENNALLLHAGRERLAIPLDAVQQFTVYGSAADPKQFTLVTPGRVYHGDFPSKGDMEEMLDALRKTDGRQVEINLNIT